MNHPWLACALGINVLLGWVPTPPTTDADHWFWVGNSLRPRIVKIAHSNGDHSGFDAPVTKSNLALAQKQELAEPKPKAPDPTKPQRIGALRGLAITGAQHWTWFWSQFRSLSAVKVGMSRSALINVVSEEGGLSTRSRQTFTAKGCPYLKVDITFDTKGPKPGQDTVASISTPHLDYAIVD